MNVNEQEIQQILQQYKTITVIGVSPDSNKPSQRVPLYMKSHGYEVVGVNPTHDSAIIAGMPIYKSLADVPAAQRQFVDVFRRSDAIPAVVDEVLKVGGVKVLWLQLGITHAEAEKKAEAAGLKVISDRCLYIEHKKYF